MWTDVMWTDVGSWRAWKYLLLCETKNNCVEEERTQPKNFFLIVQEKDQGRNRVMPPIFVSSDSTRLLIHLAAAHVHPKLGKKVDR
jgi:hypothetical protein